MSLADLWNGVGQVLSGVLAAEDNRDPFNDPRFAEQGSLGGGRSRTGIDVTSHRAMNHSAFYACLKAISETFGRVPLITYIEKGDEDRIRARKTPLYNTLTRQPNRWQTPYYFQQTWAVQKMMAGNFVSEIVFQPDTGAFELIPLHPQRLEIIEPVDEQSPPTYLAWSKAGKARSLLRDEVLHDPMLSIDGWNGISVLKAARESLGVGLAAEEATSTFYKKGMTQRGILSTPKSLTPKARAHLEKATKGGLDAAGGVLLLEEDMKFYGVSLSPEDAGLLGSHEFNVTQIARYFLMPLAKIGHMKEGASYASVEQLLIDFISSTMDPYFASGEQEVNRTLVDGPDMFVEFLRQALVQADIKTRWMAYAIALTNGVYAPNEVRSFENMKKLEGLDRPMRRLDMAPAGAQAAAAARWHTWEGKASDQARRVKLARLEEVGSRARALAEASARALVRREAKFLKAWDGASVSALEEFYRGQAKRVARDLAVPENASLLWADDRGNAVLEAATNGKKFNRQRFARRAVKGLVTLAMEERDAAA